jgi:hypothetical protein
MRRFSSIAAAKKRGLRYLSVAVATNFTNKAAGKWRRKNPIVLPGCYPDAGHYRT